MEQSPFVQIGKGLKEVNRRKRISHKEKSRESPVGNAQAYVRDGGERGLGRSKVGRAGWWVGTALGRSAGPQCVRQIMRMGLVGDQDL